MTQVIDGRVVEMKFDNSNFEKNVAQSMSTLEKLKQALNFDSGKSLQELGAATRQFSLNGVVSAVDAVQTRFSAMQVVGITALSEITKAAMHLGSTIVSKVIGPIKTGGLNRALNLEQAKFQLEGLGVAWEAVYDDINYAVKGTAYGLDSAAKAAAQLSASNVAAGDSMKRALRGISGVAAMTNQSYDDIAQIFTTVAGNGKVMASELNRIGQRGLNASAALAKYFNGVNEGTIEADKSLQKMVKSVSQGLNVTEADIKDFASKSKINFELFAAAMDSAFGQHAKDANKTFTGALSNVKAALARLGAKVYTPGLENLRLIFVDLIELIDQFSASMDGPINFINNGFEKMRENVTGVLEQTDKFKEIYGNISNGLGQALFDILQILVPIRDGFRQVFPKVTIDNVVELTAKISDFLSKLRISQETANNVARVFRGVFSIFSIFKSAIVAIVEALIPATKRMGSFADKVLAVLANIGDWIYVISLVIKQNNLFGVALERLKAIALPVFNAIGKGFDFLKSIFEGFKSTVKDFEPGKGIGEVISALTDGATPLQIVANIFKTAFGIITSALEAASPVLGAFGQLVGNAAGQIANGFEQVFSGGGFKTLLSLVNSAFLVTLGLDIAAFIHQIVGSLSKSLKMIDGIKGLIGNVSVYFKALGMSVKADSLKKIAIAIGILAASLWLLSTIPGDKLVGTLTAVTIMMAELAGMLSLMGKMSSDWKNVAGMFVGGKGIASMATGIFVLAGALKLLSTIDADSLNQAMGAMLTLMIELTTVILILGNYAKKIEAGAVAMIAFSVGIRILASAVKAFSKMSPAEMVQGLQGLTAVMIELTGALMLISGTDLGMGDAAAIIALAVAMNILSSAVETLGNMPIESLAAGLLSLFVALAEMTTVFLIFQNADTGSMFATGAAFVILAAGISILSKAISALAEMPIDNLAGAMLGLFVALAEMTTVFLIFQNMDAGKMLLTAAAMTVLSLAIITISAAIGILGNIPIQNILLGLTGLMVTLIAFGVAGAIFGAAAHILLIGAGVIAALGAACLVAAAGMAASALAIGLLASALESLAALGWGDFLSAIGMLIVSLTSLTIVAIALSPAVAVLVPLAASLMGIAIAANILAAAISVAAIGLTLFATAFKMFETIDPMAIAIGMGVLAGALGLFALLAPVLAPLGVTLLMIGGGLALIGVGAAGVAAAILLMSMAFTNLAPLVEQVSQKLGELAENIGPKITAAADAVWGALVDLGANILNFIVNIGSWLIQGVVETGANLLHLLNDLGAELLKALGVPEDWVNVAHDFIDGLITGIKEKIQAVIQAVTEVGGKMIDAIRDKIKSHSPSEEMVDVGLDFDDGLVNGVLQGKDKVVGAVADVGQGMITQAQTDADATVSIWDAVGRLTGTQKDKPSKATEELREFRKEMNDLKNPSSEVNQNLKDMAENEESLATATGKATKAGKEQKSLLESLKDTIGNQLDMFSKFELKTEMSAQTMLDNMRSNIDGFASWSHRMAVLAQRFADAGIDKGLYKKLAEMGPKGYETMNAFYQMSEEQLAEVKDLWATGLTLPDNQADIVNSGFQYMGEMAAKGFSNALDDHMAAHEAAHGLGQAALDGLSEALDVHSPSRETFKIGVFLIDGLALGMTSDSAIAMLELSVQQTSQRIIDLFTENFSEDTMGELGTGLLTNIFTNFIETMGEEDTNPIIQAFVTSLSMFDLIDEAFMTFTEHIRQLLYTIWEIEGEGAPSMWVDRLIQLSFMQAIVNALNNGLILFMAPAILNFCNGIVDQIISLWEMGSREEMTQSQVFYDIGMNAVLGLAQGILDYIPEAVAAAEELASAVEAAAKVNLEVNSPSKVFIRIGHSVGEGFVMGIEDGAKPVYNAARDLATSGIDGAATGMGRLQDVINEGLDFNPIITPMLDLSLIRSQIDELNALMAGPTYGIGQNEGDLSSAEASQPISFVQNNYSPKALSRYDIYRQTKNQISTIRKVVSG